MLWQAGSPEVFHSLEQYGLLYRAAYDEDKTIDPGIAPIKRLAVSPKGRYLATWKFDTEREISSSHALRW
jgi:hypothetical protein